MKVDTFSTLVAELYRDITLSDGWRSFFESLGKELNFVSTSLYIDDVGGISTGKSVTINQPDIAIREFTEYFYIKDIWADALPRRPLHEFHSSEALVPDREFKRSEIYNDYLKKYDIRRCCGVYIDNPASAHALKLAVHRTHSQEAFNAEEIAALNLFVPHLKNALNIHRQFFGIDSLRTAFEIVADIADNAAFLLDSNHNLVARNSLAEAFFQSSEVVLSNGKLGFTCSALNRAVQQQITEMRRFVDSKSSVCQQFAKVGDAQHGYQVRVDALPLPVTFLGQQELGILVQIRRCDSKPQISLTGLKYLFGLTRMEAEVAFCLCKGKSVPVIALQLSVKESTIRTHAKAVYSKVGVNKQSELVARVMSSLAYPE